MATQKSANDYREERKARLAKASKQNAKKSHKIGGHRMSKKAKSVIAIILVVAIVGVAGFFGCKNLGVFDRMKSIETVGGEKYSAVEYEYYYKSVHNYIYNMAAQYDQYYGAGYGYQYTGYDYSKDPAEQNYPFDDYKLEDGKDATWKQYFEAMALERMQYYNVVVDMANEANFKVSDEVKAQTEAQIEELRENIKTQAEEQGGQVVSLGAYLRASYGNGMNEKTFKDIVENETLAQEYAQHILETKGEGYTFEELEKVYKEDKSAYDVVDFRLFAIDPVTEELDEKATDEEKKAADEKAKAEAKKKAEEMFGKITDSASFVKLAEEYATEEQKEANDFKDSKTTLSTFIQKSSVQNSFSEDIIKWLYSDKTKAGEKKMFDVSGSQYIFMMEKPAYRDDETIPVDVRHILYQISEDATDKDAEKAKQKALAEAALKEIEAAADPLEKFLELVEKDSKDTGSNTTGGLYEYVGRGQMVEPFETWSLDEARKEGDLGVVETEYGYHVMYFVQKHNKPMWQITISQNLASEALQKELDEAYKTDAYAVAEDNATVAEMNEKLYAELKSLYYKG